MALRERRGGRAAAHPPCFSAGGWTTVIKARKTSVQITVFNQSAWEMICTSFSVWIVLPLAHYLCQPCQRHDGRYGEPSATCHSEGKGLVFTSLNEFSRQLSPWGPRPDLRRFRRWHHLMYISTKRRRFSAVSSPKEARSLTHSLSVNGYAGNFSVRGHSKNWAFRGTKWKYGKNNYIHERCVLGYILMLCLEVNRMLPWLF